MARLGIYGGSFDPVHVAHRQVADACVAQSQLDALWFVPTATQPHKPHGPVAPEAHRCRMLELALASEPRMRVSRLEIERGGVSYTADTLRTIHAQHPDDALFLVLGADALADLPSWREPAEIIRIATLLVVNRPGTPPVPDVLARCRLPDVAGARHVEVNMPESETSSSLVRDRIAKGLPVDGLVDDAVAAYIAQHRLYVDEHA